MRTALPSMPLVQRVLLGLGLLCAVSWAAAAENTPWPQAPEMLPRLGQATVRQPSKGIVHIADENLKTALQWVLGIHTAPTAGDLAPLTSLTSLSLRYNDIHDLHPLVTNAGLCCGDSVDLVDNPLDAPEAQADIQTLMNRGINVYY